jgi:ABC-type tungstate transport system substrate-binding protein
MNRFLCLVTLLVAVTSEYSIHLIFAGLLMQIMFADDGPVGRIDILVATPSSVEFNAKTVSDDVL